MTCYLWLDVYATSALTIENSFQSWLQLYVFKNLLELVGINNNQSHIDHLANFINLICFNKKSSPYLHIYGGKFNTHDLI